MPTASRILLALALAIGAALSASVRQQPPTSVDLLLGAALHAERVEGDLETAIALYEKALAAPGATRRQAATALLHLGFCYVRLERPEAPRTLERVVRDYAEEKDLAVQARRELQRLNQARGKAATAGPRTPRLVSREHGVMDGRPSPDGRFFSMTEDANHNLGVVELATGTKRLLTKDADIAKGGFALLSAWSPHGRQIAYQWYENHSRTWELRAIDVAGGMPRALTPPTEYLPDIAGWSGDGRSVVTRVGRKTGCELRLIDLSGAPTRTIQIPGSCNAELSPDGRFVAYQLGYPNDPEEIDISIWSVEGRRDLPVVKHPGIDRLIAWSPDSRTIAFSSDRSGTFDLYTLRLDDGRPRGQPTCVAESVGRIYGSGVTRDGSLFYYRDRRSTDVYLTRIDLQRGVLDVPKPLGRHFVGANTRPFFSPDGRFVAYLSRSPASPPSVPPNMVSIQSVDGSNYRTFLLDLSIWEIFGLRWSADGRSVLLGADDAQGATGGIYRLNLESGRTEPFLLGLLKGGPSLGTARLSADHTKIVGWFFVPDGAKIVAGTVGGSEWRELYRHPKRATLFPESLSPDGRWLAFKIGNNTASVVSLENSEIRTVLTRALKESLGYAAWTPDSCCLLYPVGKFDDQGRASSTELRLVPIDGRPTVRLTTLPMLVKWLDLSHDGRLLAFSSSTTGDLELWVIEGLFASPK